MTINDVMVHVNEAFAKAGYDFSTCGIKVSINKRLTRTLGRCKSIKHGDTYTPQLIEFSAELLATATDESVIDVIYHECAHALVSLETGKTHGHDAVFKAMCRRIDTDNDGTVTEVERTVAETEVYKYCVYCNKCGKMVGRYHRAGKVVKTPQFYSCECGGSLKVIQNY